MGAIFARAMLLVLVSTSLATCQDDDCPGTALDRAPEIKTSLTEFRKAVRSAGYVGRVLLDLTITETGEAQDPKITSPARLNSEKALIDQVRSWRFCPAVMFNQYKAGKARFDIQVGAKE